MVQDKPNCATGTGVQSVCITMSFFPPKGCASEEEISHIEEPIQQILLSTYICREIFPALVRRMDSPGTSTDRLWSRGVNRYTDISKVL